MQETKLVATAYKRLNVVLRDLLCLNNQMCNKTPAQAFTAPADEKKMGTIWIFVY